jgi:hypothetical protein
MLNACYLKRGGGMETKERLIMVFALQYNGDTKPQFGGIPNYMRICEENKLQTYFQKVM